ncbi:unnamed protein product [Calypogeia fissa]
MDADPTVPKKQANFHNVEIEQIARSWLTVSNDPVVGAQQKVDVFWSRVVDHFEKCMDDFRRRQPGVLKQVYRSQKSLAGKWSMINHDCAKFSGTMSQISLLNENGTLEDDRELRAKAMYKQLDPYNRHFACMAAWRILKENPKWGISSGVNQGKSGQKKRWSKQQGSTMNEVAPDVEDEEANDKNRGTPKRPIGNKKAKALAALERKSQSRRDALGDATNKIALALDRRAKAMEDMAEIQLFSQDLSNLGETQKHYY